MFDNIIFYNHFGNGDIFESREFVKEIISNVPASKCIYRHAKGEKFLRDICNLNYEYLTMEDNLCNPTGNSKVHGNDLYINTWIGRDGRYVLPGIGCTVEKLFDMYNDMLQGIYSLKYSCREYIPTINYSFFNREESDNFASQHEKLILISNGPVQSMQACNFDFAPIIRRVADTHKDKTFIITSNMEERPENVFYTGEFIKQDGQPDLNELSYLSTKCNMLIGRNSGPHVMSWVKENCFNRKMVNITFSYHADCHHFVHHTPIEMVKCWSPSEQDDEIFTVIDSTIGEYKWV